MEFSQIISLISLGISFLSVVAAFYAVRESRKAVISGAFFSELIDAYADYLKCVADFVYRRGLSERDALAASLYRVLLFAPGPIGDEAQALYVYVLDWAQSGQSRALSVDERVNRLGDMMRENIAFLQRNGHF